MENTQFPFQDKIVLVTGAASGIGRAAALAFAKNGATVVAADINEKGLAQTAALGAAAGGKVSCHAVDVSDYPQVERLISGISEKHGRLDVAVNNAGIGGVLAKTAEVELDDWERMLSVNASSVFYCLRQEIRQMLAQENGGSIINVASVAGLKGLPNSLPYSAAKHAVVGMTRTAAKEYARKNIRVNALCPVFTVTRLFDPAVIDAHTKGMSQRLKAQIPMGRFAEVDEQVSALLWLASDQASFVTGMAMSVDGGLTA